MRRVFESRGVSVCECRGINVSSTFADATSDVISLETLTTVADHANKMEIRLGELKSLDLYSLAFSA